MRTPRCRQSVHPSASPHQFLGSVPQALGQAVAGGGEEELAIYRAELSLHSAQHMQQPKWEGSSFGVCIQAEQGSHIPQLPSYLLQVAPSLVPGEYLVLEFHPGILQLEIGLSSTTKTAG